MVQAVLLARMASAWALGVFEDVGGEQLEQAAHQFGTQAALSVAGIGDAGTRFR